MILFLAVIGNSSDDPHTGETRVVSLVLSFTKVNSDTEFTKWTVSWRLIEKFDRG